MTTSCVGFFPLTDTRVGQFRRYVETVKQFLHLGTECTLRTVVRRNTRNAWFFDHIVARVENPEPELLDLIQDQRFVAFDLTARNPRLVGQLKADFDDIVRVSEGDIYQTLSKIALGRMWFSITQVRERAVIKVQLDLWK